MALRRFPANGPDTFANRNKLDPLLQFLLSLPPQTLKAVYTQERGAVNSTKKAQYKRYSRLQVPPLTASMICVPHSRKSNRSSPTTQTYFNAFLLANASANELTRLGVIIRSRVGDVYCVSIPRPAIKLLENSNAVRYIELVRPTYPALDKAVPFTQLDTLHRGCNQNNGATGKDVIIGVIDKGLDIYHPDFRLANGQTRILYLWDQTLTPISGESGPQISRKAQGGFRPLGGSTYGVEYSRDRINAELVKNPQQPPSQTNIRHVCEKDAHGTYVTSIAAGNGRGANGKFAGAAPDADIVFVHTPSTLENEGQLMDNGAVADAFAYIFAHATSLGRPCVVNLSNSDDQGPHDGSTLGERFLDNLLAIPGRAIVVAAGNSNNADSHATNEDSSNGKRLEKGIPLDLEIEYGERAKKSDKIEIWYDGHDRIDTTLTFPASEVIGPVSPGFALRVPVTLANGVQVHVHSTLHDPRNGDNCIHIFLLVPAEKCIPKGTIKISLTGTTVLNGIFHAWVDRNNRDESGFLPPYVKNDKWTLGTPATARGPIAVGNHMALDEPIPIMNTSGRGPTRDGRVKPEIATVGTAIAAANSGDPQALYRDPVLTGTSYSAPLVAGACACLFECRGSHTTAAQLKQILEDTAGKSGISVPDPAFGFGYMQIGKGCCAPAPAVDVWLKDHPNDNGAEPSTQRFAWLSPDIEIVEKTVASASNSPGTQTVRITVRNRGTSDARNTEVHVYWAHPATYIPFPRSWHAYGFYNDATKLSNQSNKIVIPTLAPGHSERVEFGWRPPTTRRHEGHPCFIARLENENDPSQARPGRWDAVTARNNIALRNLHQRLLSAAENSLSFHVVGAGFDSLFVNSELLDGEVTLVLPIQLIPWHDSVHNKAPRGVFGEAFNDPLASVDMKLKRSEIHATTDILGASSLRIRDGFARITMDKAANRMDLPFLRIARGTRAPAKLVVNHPKIDGQHKHVHVSQYSQGQLVGGITLELHIAESTLPAGE